VGPVAPDGLSRIAERATGSGLYRATGWSYDAPWLVDGITGHDADMSLFGESAAGVVVPRWLRLCETLECRTVVHARQVHGSAVLVHEDLPAGLVIAPDADGHVTAQAGLLLAVAVADCVPVFVVDPVVRVVALLHGGWRGIAAGVLENGISALTRLGAQTRRMRVHLGPAICGDCYEVGPEVTAGLDIDAGDRVTHVDLRAELAQRAMACGVPVGHVTMSTHCTRHGESPFFSHRAGCSERQIAVLGIRARGA
jgi:polyphenol oxidase